VPRCVHSSIRPRIKRNASMLVFSWSAIVLNRVGESKSLFENTRKLFFETSGDLYYEFLHNNCKLLFMKKFAVTFFKFSKIVCFLTKPFTFSQFFTEIIGFHNSSLPEVLERHAAGWGEETVPQKQVVILQQPVHLKLRASHQVPDLGGGEGE
jgi:hypothetical protein